MKTFSKWIANNDKTPNTVRWFSRFNYDKADREHVATLSCVQFVSDVMISCCVLHMCSTACMAYVVGSTILRTFPFKEHAASDMDRKLIRSAQNRNITTYFVCTLGEAAWRQGQLVRRMMKPVLYGHKTHRWWSLLVFQSVLMSDQFYYGHWLHWWMCGFTLPIFINHCGAHHQTCVLWPEYLGCRGFCTTSQ